MTPDKQLDALVAMFPDLVWRNEENGRLLRRGSSMMYDPLNCRGDILNLIKFPGFFPHRKKFVQELVHRAGSTGGPTPRSSEWRHRIKGPI